MEIDGIIYYQHWCHKEKKMNLKDLLESKESLTYLFSKEIPGKNLMEMISFQEKVKNELSKYEKCNNKLIEKFGEKKDNYYQVKKDTENWDNYLKEYTDLINSESDVGKYDLNFIFSLDSFQASHALNLKKFFKDGDNGN